MVNNIAEDKSETIQVYVAAVALWMLTFPYYFWSFASISVFVYRIVFLLIVGIVFYKHCRNKRKCIDVKLIRLFCATLFYFIITTILKGDANLFGIISPFFNLFLLNIAFAEIPFVEKVFSAFSKVFAYAILISLVVWVGVESGMLSPSGMIDNPSHDRLYYRYPFLIVMAEDLNSIVDTFRFHGPYDEPGVVGTFCSIILCVNKFELKNKENIICFVAGICSFSFFFAIVASVYVVLYYCFIERNNKLLILFLIIGSIFYLKTKDDEMVYNTLWHRFEYNQDEGKISGINRMSDEADIFYNNLSFTEYLFGGDEEKYQKVVEGSASYKSVVISNGIIFLVMYLSFFVFYAKSRTRKRFTFLLFLFVLLGNTFQRPDIYGTVVFFLYICLANNREFSFLREKTNIKLLQKKQILTQSKYSCR